MTKDLGNSANDFLHGGADGAGQLKCMFTDKLLGDNMCVYNGECSGDTYIDVYDGFVGVVSLALFSKTLQ